MSQATDYETDILEWSERQATALRDLARARPPLSNELDWENVAEEIKSVGRSEFKAVNSYVRQILIHLIKAVSFPDAPTMQHWRKEVAAFHQDLVDNITPSMRRRLNLGELWKRALRLAEIDFAADGRLLFAPLEGECPVSLDDLLDPGFDFLATMGNVRRRLENR